MEKLDTTQYQKNKLEGGEEEALLRESTGGTRLPKHGGLFSSRKEMNEVFHLEGWGICCLATWQPLAILLGASLHLNPLNIREII